MTRHTDDHDDQGDQQQCSQRQEDCEQDDTAVLFQTAGAAR